MQEKSFYEMTFAEVALAWVCSGATLPVLISVPGLLVWTSYLCNPRMSFTHEHSGKST